MRRWLLALTFLLLDIAVSCARQRMYWLPEGCKNNRNILFDYFDQAGLLGLDAGNYAASLVAQLKRGECPKDSFAADQELTDAAVAFFRDVAYGDKEIRVGFNGLNYQPDCLDIEKILENALSDECFGTMLGRIEPSCPEYRAVKRQIAMYRTRLGEATSQSVSITSMAVDSTNRPLIEKLYQLGCVDSFTYDVSKDVLREQLRKAQHLFEFMEDGSLRPGIIEELNVPLEKRIRELKRTLHTFRWLNCIRRNQQVIVVNIPAAGVYLYKGDSLLLYSRAIVGKSKTPTPTLSSKVTELIMFPYWTVPHNIATKELLPAIKGNLVYLDAGNYQVLDKNGTILDPATINWQVLNSRNFPYTIRQMNGCDNSLGIMKLNFMNPYDVYLHDTPWKSYFMFNKRYYSHGCVRVEDAVALGRHLIPQETQRIDSLEKMACTPEKGPVSIPLKHNVPVFILYEVAWPDMSGEIRFYDDVYSLIP